VVGQPIFLSNSAHTADRFPSVCKSSLYDNWMITWERDEPALGESNIWGARFHSNQGVLAGPFQITSGSIDKNSCVSSLGLVNRTMVVYERDFGSDWDIVASVLDGNTVVQQVNLSLLEGTWFLQDQRQPTVDTNGNRFLVGYSEQYLSSTTDYDIYVSDYYIADNVLRLANAHMNLAFTTAFEGVVRLDGRGYGGPLNDQYTAAWHRTVSANNSDIHVGLVITTLGGTATPFCFGDGTDGDCPCGNNGSEGSGCASSINNAGAHLEFTGLPAIFFNDARLVVSNVPSAALCIFLQSANPPGVTPYGDGLACIGTGMLRLKTMNASAGSATFPPVGHPDTLQVLGGVPLGGGRRAYQVYYRNSANFCTPAGYNITNGVLVDWAP
jgi:hypothetical protein